MFLLNEGNRFAVCLTGTEDKIDYMTVGGSNESCRTIA